MGSCNAGNGALDADFWMRLEEIVKPLGTCLLLVASLGAQDGIGSSFRASINLNGTWQYVLNQPQSQIPPSGWQAARLPGAPLTDGTVSAWYKAAIFIPQDWAVSGRRFFLRLEKCGHYCAIYLNGQFAGDHYGQFSPYEAEVTPFVLTGNSNEVEVYAHNADSTYTRRDAVIDQSSCPHGNPNCLAASYRPAAGTINQRNWVGLVGDVTFSWRPQAYVSTTQVITSFRNSTITAVLAIVGASPGATVAADVLDAGTEVIHLPAQPVTNGATTLVAPWANPVLWGPTPYGLPHLYQLRVTLMESGSSVDTAYVRFGFREVWVDGTTVLLNGQRLWMTTSFLAALARLRTTNDRRPQAFQNYIQQQSGQNAETFHWDDAGQPALDLADEQGILVLGAFFCNGVDKSMASVDNPSAWTAWMAATATEWTAAELNHPSIVLWRPMDVLPPKAGNRAPVDQALEQAIHSVDLTRPIADNSDVDVWAQSAVSPNNPNTCDNGSELAQKLASETKPLLIKELYGFTLPCTSAFLSTIYGIAYPGGAVGMIEQELEWTTYSAFNPDWFSQSGTGNRLTPVDGLPDWVSRKWTATNWSAQFAALYTQYTGLAVPCLSPSSGDYQASHVIFDTAFTGDAIGTAFLIPPAGTGEAVGITVASDATAWFVTPFVGSSVLAYGSVQQEVVVQAPSPF